MKSEFAKMKTCLILILWISVTLALNAPMDPMDKDMDINQMDKKVMDNSGDLDRRRFFGNTGGRKQARPDFYRNNQERLKALNDHFAALQKKYGNAHQAHFEKHG